MKQVLKWGCIGCLGVVALVVIAVGVLIAVISLQTRSEKVDTQELTHAVPAVEPPVAAAAGRVVLHYSQGGFFLERGKPGEPLRVKARYDENSYELKEEWLTPEGGPWTYTLDFDSKGGGGFLHHLRQWLGGTAPEIHVTLPPDAPIALDVELSQAGAEIDLGGLWLTAADVEINQGGMQIVVSEPLVAPIDELSIRAAMGGVEARSIGNASPRKLRLDASMGGVELDLSGAWVADSTIVIATKMGGVEVVLPKDVNVVGATTGRLPAGPEPELKRPTLTFEVQAEMGDVEFKER